MKLFVITNSYPYGLGEAFLETEMEYLSRRFENIIILPLRLDNNKRDIPKNAVIDKRLAQMIEKNKFPKISLLFNIHFLKNLSYNIKYLRHVYSHIKYIKFFEKYFNNYFDDSDFKNTIFYTYWFTEPTSALSIFKTKFQYKLITRAHRFDLYEERSGLTKFPFRQHVLNNINKVHLISKDGIEHLKSKYKISDNKLSYSPLGIKENTKQISHATPKNKNGIDIVSCSFLKEVKRVDLIIKALSKINNIKINWTHLGGGPLEKDLKKLIKESNFFNNIKLNILGNMSNSEILNYYKNNYIDAFINVSSSEGIPVSIMEAQSFGIPVIATNVGGTAEIVNNDNGILLSANPSIDEIVNAIKKININNWEEKRIKSYENWRNNFNAEINYNIFINNLY